MSYVIHLFEHPGPATLAEAASLHERLSATPAGRNERLLRWANAMQARFPADHAGWLEGAPDGDTGGSAVLSVGLTHAGLDRLLPAAVSLALPLGLCLFDEQAGRCYLPGGWALTPRGRFALKPAAAAPAAAPTAPAPAAPAAPRLEPGSGPWALQRLLKRMAPELEAHGFRAFHRMSRLRFARTVPMGIQSLTLVAWDGPKIQPSVELEPLLPHALVRAIRPGRTLPCHTHRLGGLPRFGAAAQERPDPWYTVRCSEHEIDALADALLAWFVDAFIPLLEACRDLPGILRCEGPQEALPAHVGTNRTQLALQHWVHGGDLSDAARRVATLTGTRPEIALRAAQVLQAQSRWAGTWRPMAAPSQLYDEDEAVSAPALAEAALPRLLGVAQAHGFQLVEQGPLMLRLRRQSTEVEQTLCVEVKPLSLPGAELKVEMLWQAPALTAHWLATLPGAPAALGTWQDSGPPSYRWLRGPLELLGIDSGDLNLQVQWPDELADHVQFAEQALRDSMVRAFDPALRWQGLAAQLPSAQDFSRWAGMHWMSSSLSLLQPGGWAAVLMLASLYRQDAAAYAQALRAAHLADTLEPLLQAVEAGRGAPQR
ncbi:hypothetical protein [Roseateles sp. BYS87W]|uniref:Uncharacterized protein n=1 Tax=Pelomonas baiyunensis TaxID=3299026 RepID=A0ABW7GYU4_9BURK